MAGGGQVRAAEIGGLARNWAGPEETAPNQRRAETFGLKSKSYRVDSKAG
jgi:hypothetical protein